MNIETGAEGAIELMYRLDSVKPVDAPKGSDGVWYSYRIVQGSNVITGMRSCAPSEIDYALRQMVERLNERSGRQRAKQAK